MSPRHTAFIIEEGARRTVGTNFLVCEGYNPTDVDAQWDLQTEEEEPT